MTSEGNQEKPQGATETILPGDEPLQLASTYAKYHGVARHGC
jgi:hypothetical protein